MLVSLYNVHQCTVNYKIKNVGIFENICLYYFFKSVSFKISIIAELLLLLDRALTKADQEGCSTENYQIADGTICGSLQATDNGNEFKSFQGTKNIIAETIQNWLFQEYLMQLHQLEI